MIIYLNIMSQSAVSTVATDSTETLLPANPPACSTVGSKSSDIYYCS